MKEEYFICSLLVELIWFIVVFAFFVFPISINLGVAGVEWSLLAFLVKVNYYFKTVELCSKCTEEIFGYVVYLDIQKN